MGTVSGYELLSLLSIFWTGKDKNYWFCISDNFIHHLGSSLSRRHQSDCSLFSSRWRSSFKTSVIIKQNLSYEVNYSKQDPDLLRNGVSVEMSIFLIILMK